MHTPSQQNSENKISNTPGVGDPSTQNREEGKPYIVTITQENIDRVSIAHKGLLQNPDGTLSMTPQYDTWTSNTNMQLQKLYVTLPGLPAEIDEWYHPKATLLDLDWSHEGEWVKIPISKDDKGPEYKDCRIARIEKYIDLKGKIRRAVSYGNEETKLKVWFSIEDMKAAFSNWYIPHPCPYYNGKRFNPGHRRQTGSNPNPNPKPNPQPRDQSGKDIQGRRGNQQSYRGRGRGHRGNQPRGRVNTYQDWDNQQSAGSSFPKDSQQWEQDAWDNYQQATAVEKGARPKEYRSRDQYRDQQQQYSRPQRESHRNQQQPREGYQRERGRERGNPDQEYDQRDPQEGYYTREFVDRKREQSRDHHRDEYQSIRPRGDSRTRYREMSRDRQGERRQRDRSMSPRRQRERNPSPRNDTDSGRGRGGRQRERSFSPRNDSGRGRGGGYERRGSDASYGGT